MQYNALFYPTLESAQEAEAYFKNNDSVDHYLGPTYEPHWAKEREKEMLRTAILEQERGWHHVWEY